MNIGLVGTGKMGSAIFKPLSATSNDICVLAIDADEAEKKRQKYFKRIERAFKRGRISEDDYRREKTSRRFTDQVKDLAGSQLIIEAIFEDYDAKVDLFQELESVVKNDAVLVSNTSANSIAAMAKTLKYKDRFCGLHFFHPVSVMKLVEIVKTADTPAELVDFLKNFCYDIRRKPIVVLDAPGSVINAILIYYYVEAFYMLEAGLCLPSEIDALAKRYFYVGPCESVDVIGIDLFLKALKTASVPGGLSPLRWTEKPQEDISEPVPGAREGFYVPNLFRKLVFEKRLGKSAARGLYNYQRENPTDEVPEFYLDEKGLTPRSTGVEDEDFLAKRLLYSVFNGSLDSLKKGMSSMEELDLGLKEVLLMRAGPFTMMKNIGPNVVRENFDILAEKVGTRFKQTIDDFLTP